MGITRARTLAAQKGNYIVWSTYTIITSQQVLAIGSPLEMLKYCNYVYYLCITVWNQSKYKQVQLHFIRAKVTFLFLFNLSKIVLIRVEILRCQYWIIIVSNCPSLNMVWRAVTIQKPSFIRGGGSPRPQQHWQCECMHWMDGFEVYYIMVSDPKKVHICNQT